MKAQIILAIVLLVISSTSFRIEKTRGCFSPRDVYEGSTPAGAFIKSALKIPTDVTCEFIKWKVSISNSQAGVGTFNASLWYGESQPNTNGFKNGGHWLQFYGKYKTRNGDNKFRSRQVIELHSSTLNQSISLLKINDALFYILDKNDNLLIGNGGFSYVLNKSAY